MKTEHIILSILMVAVCAQSGTTIDPANKYAYGANKRLL